jgi:hypothetical protein
MPEMTVTVAQLDGRSAAPGRARDRRVLIGRPEDTGDLATGTRLTVRRA